MVSKRYTTATQTQHLSMWCEKQKPGIQASNSGATRHFFFGFVCAMRPTFQMVSLLETIFTVSMNGIRKWLEILCTNDPVLLTLRSNSKTVFALLKYLRNGLAFVNLAGGIAGHKKESAICLTRRVTSNPPSFVRNSSLSCSTPHANFSFSLLLVLLMICCYWIG